MHVIKVQSVKSSTLSVYMATFLFYAAVAMTSFMAFVALDVDAVQTQWDKFNHFFSFFVLLLLFDHAYPRVEIYYTKIIALFIYGLLIEAIQYFIPGRQFSLLDILANAIGLLAYLTVRPLFLLLIHTLDFSSNK